MPTLHWNRAEWDNAYDWRKGGEDWSGPWGTTDMQWYGTLLPRLHRYVPATTVVEIAPGAGRWTRYLLPLSERLIGVDLSEQCVEACEARFADVPSASFHVNDGCSLPMVEDGSADLVFSFDSLVHAELKMIQGYLAELHRVLSADGAAFLHHSNLGAHEDYLRRLARLRRLPRGQDRLTAWGFLDPIDAHHRETGVSADLVRRSAEEAGLSVVSQELINWRGTRRVIDCITVIARPGSRWDQPTQVVHNPDFSREASHWRDLAPLYAS